MMSLITKVITILYVNKAVHFIDLQNIFKDKRVIDQIRKNSQNSEAPIICYKYKKPKRNLIHNNNQTLSMIDTDTIEPTTCDCSNSKFYYASAGHVITGDVNVITDRRLRNLISRGSKIWLPGPIDFKSCRPHIAEAINPYCNKWCKRENTDPNALSTWKSLFSVL